MYMYAGQFKGKDFDELPLQYVDYLAGNDLSRWPRLRSEVAEIVNALDFEEQLEFEIECDGVMEFDDDFADENWLECEDDYIKVAIEDLSVLLAAPPAASIF